MYKEKAFTEAYAGEEINTRFDTRDAELESIGATVRLRQTPKGFLLTVKEKIDPSRTDVKKPKHCKLCEELNAEVSDPGVVRKIFSLFFAREESYCKVRRHWELSFSGICVEIDLVPELNRYFVEIEAPTEKDIDEFRKRFGLSWDSVEPKSYFQLIREAREKKANKKNKKHS